MEAAILSWRQPSSLGLFSVRPPTFPHILPENVFNHSFIQCIALHSTGLFLRSPRSRVVFWWSVSIVAKNIQLVHNRVSVAWESLFPYNFLWKLRIGENTTKPFRTTWNFSSPSESLESQLTDNWHILTNKILILSYIIYIHLHNIYT